MSDLFLDEELLEKKTIVTLESLDAEDDFLSIKLKAKELSSQIDWVGNHYKFQYLPELLKLQNHTSKQVRRKVANSISLLGNKDILDDLRKWQLKEADRDTWLVLEATIDKITRRIDGVQTQKTTYIYTVSEAISLIKSSISEKIYTIEGELSEVKLVNQMYYFSIKDKQDTRLDCRAFINKIVSGNFPLNEGLTVRITGKFNLSKFAKLVFEIQKIELTGEGELLRNLKLLENKLDLEGFFDPNSKKILPQTPKNILLIASPNSAAIGDFTKTLQDRIGGINIYFLPIISQGVASEMDILQKLEIAKRAIKDHSIDAVVLTRGGGSSDDLWVFNSEKIVRSLHTISCPTIVAIGHERDWTLAEKVADVRASTPSKAAVLVSLSRVDILLQLQSSIQFFRQNFSTRKHEYLMATNQLVLLSQKQVEMELYTAQNLSQKIDHLLEQLIFSIKFEVQSNLGNIQNLVNTHIQLKRLEIPNIIWQAQKQHENILSQKVLNQNIWLSSHQLVANLIEKLKNQVDIVAQTIQLFNPETILQKGYALIWQDEKIVESKHEFVSHKPFEIQLKDGKMQIKKYD